jgi:glycosyltransferase involved in cell wall biosynthesis
MLGGGEYSFLDLLSQLPQDWHALAVMPEEGELAVRLEEKGIETRVIPLPALRPWFIPTIFRSLSAYYTTCRKVQPDLIYANGSRAAFYGGIAGRFTRIPVIWHCRVADPDPRLDFLLGRLSNEIIVNSKFASHRFSKSFFRKVELAYNGVDTEWLKNTDVEKPSLIKEKWKTVLMVARLSRSKRHDLALLAFEDLARSDPQLHLVCLGSKDPKDPGWWDYLQDRTSQSPFGNRIHWVGQCDDVRPWYRASVLLILPTDTESFGRVLIEAMACGVPVVAASSGGIPELVRHGTDGLLITPGAADELAASMHAILNDDALRESMINSSQKRAEDFSLGLHVARMTRIFEDIIEN